MAWLDRSCLTLRHIDSNIETTAASPATDTPFNVEISDLQTALSPLPTARRPGLLKTFLWVIITRTHYWYTSLPVSIAPPNASVLKPFFLPDLNLGFDLFEALLACQPCSFAMRRRNCDDDTFFADVHASKTMAYRDARQGVRGKDGSAYPMEGFESKWGIGGIGQMSNGL